MKLAHLSPASLWSGFFLKKIMKQADHPYFMHVELQAVFTPFGSLSTTFPPFLSLPPSLSNHFSFVDDVEPWWPPWPSDGHCWCLRYLHLFPFPPFALFFSFPLFFSPSGLFIHFCIDSCWYDTNLYCQLAGMGFIIGFENFACFFEKPFSFLGCPCLFDSIRWLDWPTTIIGPTF